MTTSPSSFPAKQQPPQFFYDSGASINAVNNLQYLLASSINTIDPPVLLGGIGSSVLLTHTGLLLNFPSPFNKAYFGSTLSSNIISLGNLQRLGGWYGVDPTNNHRLLIKTSKAGQLIDSVLLSSNNLLPTSLNPVFLPPLPLYPLALLTTAPTPTIHHPPSYNSEQRTRAALAYSLHQFNHASDKTNGLACECGIIPLSLTRTDFAAMSDIYGACGSCVAGKNSTVSHGSPSSNPPPTTVGALIHADLVTLRDNSTVLLSKDDHTGYLHAVKLPLGKTKASLTAGWDSVRRFYNSRGWKLLHVNTDSEEAFKVCQGPLQDRGIFCSVTPPEKHEKSLERSWQTILKKMNVLLDTLPYILPPPLHFSLLQFVCDLLNTVPNSKFPFSSPHIILHGIHNGYSHFPHSIPLPFGTIVRSLEAPGIDPQTGIVVGLTPASQGSHQIFYPHFHGQSSSTILSRAATQLTRLQSPPPSWHLPARFPSAHLPPSPPTSPIAPIPASQPVLHPPLASTLPSLPCSLPPTPLLPLLSLPPTDPPPPSFPALPSYLPPPSFPAEISAFSLPHQPLPTPPATSLPSSQPPLLSPRHPPYNLFSSPHPSLPPIPALLHPSCLHLLPYAPLPPLYTPPTPIITPPLPRYSTRSTNGITAPRLRHQDDGYRTLLSTSPLSPNYHPPPLKAGLLRRLHLSRSASSRAKPYSALDRLRNTIPVNNSNFYYHTITPLKQTTEFSLKTANLLSGTAATNVITATSAEMSKCLTKYQSVRPIRYSDIESNAIRLPSLIFYKQKDLLLKARLVVCGTPNHIPPDAKGITYAGAADPANIIAVIAAYRADAIHRKALQTLISFSTDIPSAYLQNDLTRADTGGHQVVMRLPTQLPHPLAGKWVELLKSQYGLPWSNSIHARELTKTLADAGFHPAHVPGYDHTPVDRYIYHCVEPSDPLLKSTLCVTIDDIQGIGFHQPHFTRLQSILRHRYGQEIEFDYSFNKYAGQQYHPQPDGGLTVDCSQYIQEMLTSFGITDIEGASTPTGPDFFHTTTDTTPFDSTKYQKATGALTWVSTRGRPDIAMAANYLSSFNSAPTSGHWLKILRIFRYLYYTIELGLTYHTTDGPILHCSTDVSYNSQTNGDAQAGLVISIGRYSAPIYVQAGHLGRKIPLGPCQAEYNSAPTSGHWLKILRIFRYLYYTIELGLTYHTTDGPILHCSTDVSYNSQTNGDAQAGLVISIGRYSAPIYVQAGHLGRKIPLGPCQAEYMGMTNGVKAVTWFRALLSAIGYPQLHPTPLYQDNMSAKHLAESPSIQRRSRHIDMFEHANRQAVQDGLIKIFHQPTADQRADILTKPMGPLQFIYQRSVLMNHSARTVFNPIITRNSLHTQQ